MVWGKMSWKAYVREGANVRGGGGGGNVRRVNVGGWRGGKGLNTKRAW